MAAVAGPLLGGLLGGLFGGGGKNKAPAQIAAPTVPTGANAEADAKAQLDKKRRISLLQGGSTDLTKGTGAVGTGSVLKKTLGE